MKKLAVSLAVLLVLLLVADRGGAALAERAVAADVQSRSALTAPPEVEIVGFPFLTQALAGRYDRIEVRAAEVPAGELMLSQLDATLTGVQVPLSEALSGPVAEVPVEQVTAEAVVPYAGLVRRSDRGELTIAPEGDRVRVTGTVEVAGQEVSAAAVSTVEVVDGAIVVTAEEFEVGSETIGRLLTRLLRRRFDFAVPVALPYGLTVTAVEVRPEGVLVLASATDTVIG